MSECSLERFFPEQCERLGIQASNIGRLHARRHYERYRKVAFLLKPHISSEDVVGDIGCGSGYGTMLLNAALYGNVRDLWGFDVDRDAIEYARIKYDASVFSTSLPCSPSIAVMVESIEHMKPEDFDRYTEKSRLICLTTPLILEPTNPVHITPYRTDGEIAKFLNRRGWAFITAMKDYNIEFTTGERGDQFYGVLRRG